MNNIVESSQSGDQESAQIRAFLLATSYDDVLKELSAYDGYAKRFQENRQWHDQVTAGIQLRCEGASETGASG